MTEPQKPQNKGMKWLWVALMIVLTFLVVTVIFDPSGVADGSVEDPIVIQDMGTGPGAGETPPESVE